MRLLDRCVFASRRTVDFAARGLWEGSARRASRRRRATEKWLGEFAGAVDDPRDLKHEAVPPGPRAVALELIRRLGDRDGRLASVCP